MSTSNKCRLCGKAIQDPDASFGPDCQTRYAEALMMIETTEAEVGRLTMTGDATVWAWLRKMSAALVLGLRADSRKRIEHFAFARRFLASARSAHAAPVEAVEWQEAA